MSTAFAVPPKPNVNSAPRLCAHSLAQVLYVEVTVSEKDDARLYKALVRWLTLWGSWPGERRKRAERTTRGSA